MTSRKFRSIGWEARTIYCATYPFADRDGRLPGDHEELWAYTGAAILIGVDGFAKVVREIIDSGLWKEGLGPDGDRFVEIRAFSEAQSGFRYDREKPGRWDSGPTPDLLRSDSGPTPAQDAGPTPDLLRLKGREGEVEGKGKGKGETESSTPEPFHVGAEETRIRISWSRAFEESTKQPCHMKPRDVETIRQAATLGTCRPWPTTTDLRLELSRTIAGLKKRSMQIDARNAINHIGESWEDRAHKSTTQPPGPSYEDFTGRAQELLMPLDGEAP